MMTMMTVCICFVFDSYVGTFSDHIQHTRQCTPVIAVYQSAVASSHILHPIIQRCVDIESANAIPPFNDIMAVNVNYMKCPTLIPLQHGIFHKLVGSDHFEYTFEWKQMQLGDLIDDMNKSSYYIIGFCLDDAHRFISPPQSEYDHYLVIHKSNITERDSDTGSSKCVGLKIKKRLYLRGIDNDDDGDIALYLHRLGYDLSCAVLRRNFALGDLCYAYSYKTGLHFAGEYEGLQYQYDNDGMIVTVDNASMKRYDVYINYSLDSPLPSVDHFFAG
eukprot:990646_1